MRFLIDENLSPRVVRWLNQAGYYAQHVNDVGLTGASDPTVWRFAYENDLIVVTVNVGDFLSLASHTDLHPGIVAIRDSGLLAHEQYEYVQEAVLHIETHLGGQLLNQAIDIRGNRCIEVLDIP